MTTSAKGRGTPPLPPLGPSGGSGTKVRADLDHSLVNGGKKGTSYSGGSQRFITQQETAELLGLSSRQVRNLIEKGLPTISQGGKVTLPWPATLKWYLAWKQADDRPATLAEAEQRLTNAKAKLAEMQVAMAEGRMVAVEDVASEVGAMLDQLRAQLLGFASKYAHDLVGCKTIGEATVRLDAAVKRLMECLSAPVVGQPNG